MFKGIDANRILSVFLPLMFIIILIALVSEMQKPSCSPKEIQSYSTSYLIFEEININHLIVLKSIIFSFMVLLPIFVGINLVVRGKVEKTSNWFLMALLILVAAGIYLTFLI